MTSDTRSLHGPTAGLGTNLIQAVLAILILVAPLLSGGIEPLPRLLLEWLGLILIGLALWQPPQRAGLSTVEGVLLGALFLLPVLYLVPWPDWLLVHLSGRERYRNAIALVAGQGLEAGRTLSIHPFATETAWLTTLIPIGIYLGTRTLAEGQARRLVYLLFAAALLQVLIGLFQFAGESTGVDYGIAGLAPLSHIASGTFRNRDHLAGMLEMVFPLALALFLFHLGRTPRHDRPSRSRRQRLIGMLRAGGRPSQALVLLAMLLLVGIVLTRSRSGIVLAMLGIVLTASLFARYVGSRETFGMVGRLLTLAVGFAAALGLAPVLDRFSTSALVADARWSIATTTFDGAGRLLPLGSGPGTYPDAYLINQPIELGQWFIPHAHNDYLEALYETGLWAPALLVLFLGLGARQWSRLMDGVEWSEFRCIQIGAGVGLTLLLGHSLTDYNLHTPANLGYFAFLAGLFFAPPGRLPVTHGKQRRERRTRTMQAMASAPTTPRALDAPVADRRPRNPFDA
ncbi:O-antigen ligase [uncultured Thiodictyon sp.]|uniref:O-antigen ligase family protein n=1 Tax=uncultured Thiodictyon sp. TaxID=1846217 RepID=UPI0025EFB59E|nr:O-antigen ligase family protein [uncultured Thiodictyon sp.]